MKKYFSAFVFTFFIVNCISAQESECFRTALFGKVDICLPEIQGYQECYTEALVKQLADGTEVPANMVLGFYLNDHTYSRRDSLGLFTFDDYFKIYGTKQVQNELASETLLLQMQDLLAGTFMSKDWDLVQREVDKIGLDVEVGVPVIIKKYNLNNKTFTFILLSKYKFEGQEAHTLAMSMNGLLINERLIWMAYYLDFEGEQTIVRLQEKSDMIVTNLLEAGE